MPESCGLGLGALFVMGPLTNDFTLLLRFPQLANGNNSPGRASCENADVGITVQCSIKTKAKMKCLLVINTP